MTHIGKLIEIKLAIDKTSNLTPKVKADLGNFLVSRIKADCNDIDGSTATHDRTLIRRIIYNTLTTEEYIDSYILKKRQPFLRQFSDRRLIYEANVLVEDGLAEYQLVGYRNHKHFRRIGPEAAAIGFDI